MDIFQWIFEFLPFIAALYQLTLITVFVVFAMRIGDVKTLDDLIPEEGEKE